MWLQLTALLWLAAACGEGGGAAEDPGEGTEETAEPAASTDNVLLRRRDAGAGDAGSGADAGSAADGGLRSDGGAGGADAGSSADGGSRMDGGINADGGTRDAGLPPGTLPDGGCLAGPLLTALGKTALMVGASMQDSTASQAPFDFRYDYLAGGVADGTGPCTSCTSGCYAGGQSCAQGACGWWGCWQDTSLPPGQYLVDYVSRAKSLGVVPMVTYYELLHTSGALEGVAEVLATQDATLMRRYFSDWRFLLQKIGNNTALLHIEPDFWGYAQMLNQNPHLIPAAVNTANPTDCASYENSIAGMARCMIAMVRIYAPKAKVGLHASGWSTSIDVLYNQDLLLDVTSQAKKTAQFLLDCGGGSADFVVVDASDRDAGYYASIGRNAWWDTTNTSLPHFRQAFTWARALAVAMNRPLIWWQTPVGNMGLANTWNAWRDNRLDYFFDHPGEVANTYAAGVAYGAGADGMTTPESDNGHLVSRTRSYASTGRFPVCR